MFQYFYNESLRKLVVAFGNLFNNVQIGKYDSNGTLTEKIRVPLTYAPKEKFIRRIRNMSSISDDITKTQITLPHMAFDITAVIYDLERVTNKLRKKSYKNESNQRVDMWNEVPYNVSFGLYIFSRYIDENLQIVEQILPYFSPNFNVSLNFNDSHTKVDVPINLNAMQIQEDYAGDFQVRRSVVSTLSFTAKTYVYGRATTVNPIEGVTVDVLDMYKYDSVTDPQTLRVQVTGDYATGTSGDVTYEVTQ